MNTEQATISNQSIEETLSNTIDGTVGDLKKSSILLNKRYTKRIIDYKLCHIVQFFYWFIFMAIAKVLFNLEIQNKERLKGVQPPVIFISNHIRFYDSALYRLAIGFISPLMPVRFMSVTKFDHPGINFFYKIGIIPFIYWITGVIGIVPGQGVNKNLDGFKKALSEGDVVAIFPEGRLYYDDTIGPFKWGAAILAEETGNPILPFAMKKHGRKLVVSIGELFYVDKNKGPTENTEFIRDKVVDLFNKIEI